ncbi:MAG: metal-dependent hydrolase [Sinobacteraceae bacterium]|nr:metal-dependent hydrolase [Nevskiaceae bacterium]
MDSISQFALGAGLGVAIMGRRTAVWKAALWGGIAGTIPDLDALIDHGDPIRNMTLHRAASHSLLYLTMLSPLLAWTVTRIHGEAVHFRRWWLALWAALFTHPLLDTMTIYGTQLLQPFSAYPFALGSMFIIDPLYTLPLLLGLLVTAADRGPARWRWNRLGLALSTLYLGWSLFAQAWATTAAERELTAAGVHSERLLVIPTGFNTLLWRIVAMEPGGATYHEGFWSPFDRGRPIRFDRYTSDRELFNRLRGNWGLERIAWFSHGFFRVERRGDIATIADLRMGQEPDYFFRFDVARWQSNPGWLEIPYRISGSRGDVATLLRWLWPRMLGADLPPPHTQPSSTPDSRGG